MQHDVPISPAVLQLSRMFDISNMGKRRKEFRPAPLGSLCFQVLHLRDAIRSGGLKDKQAICKTAVEIDRDLMAWAASLPTHATADAPVGSPDETYFQGKTHGYSDLLIAQAWNNWRTLRIIVKQMIIQNEACSDSFDITHASSSAPPMIRQLSDDICISAASFAGSPRKSCRLFVHGVSDDL